MVPRETETEPEDGLEAENSQSGVPIYQAFSGRFSIPQGARPRETALQTQTEVPSSEVAERGTSRSGEPPPGEGVSTPPGGRGGGRPPGLTTIPEADESPPQRDPHNLESRS